MATDNLTAALFGAGTIARMQAGFIREHPNLRLKYIYDVRHDAARALAFQHGATAVDDPDIALADAGVDLAFICTSTASHADLIVRAARAGKRVYCEKPVADDLASALACRDVVRDMADRIHIGFNRRWDPNNVHLHRSLTTREVGDLEMLFITSRDVVQLGRDYLATSGGIFRDVTVHDFDLARHFLQIHGDDVAELHAYGSRLFHPVLQELDRDYDTAVVTLRSTRGVLCTLNTSRRSAYGYDQRIELFCSDGMLVSTSQKVDGVETYTGKFTEAASPYVYSFVERYRQAFRDQLRSFVAAARENRPVDLNINEAVDTMFLAEAAVESAKTGAPVAITFPLTR